MELRYYQREAVEAIYQFLRTRAGNPCAVLPTGAGKSLVIAQLCADAVTVWGGRVLVLAHVKELLEQNAAELRSLCPGVDVGIYSAGLNRREAGTAVVVAGVQSVYARAAQLGHFDLVVIDEAHLIPEAGDGMYRSLIHGLTETNPDLRIVGLTATPYRLGLGLICRPTAVLNEICYEAGVKRLVAEGFLCPLVGKAAIAQIDTAGLAVRKGEFADDAAEARFIDGDEVARAVAEIGAATAERKSVLIFCQTVAHAQKVYAALSYWLNQKWLPGAVALVHGETDDSDRERAVAGFKSGDIKYLVNVNVFTTGFNAKNVDCVCLLRATLSPGLFCQMLGRGIRLSPNKADCLVLDFGGNIERHGPADAVKPSTAGMAARNADNAPRGRVCPECRTVSAAWEPACPCGFTWPEPEPAAAPHAGEATDADPLSGKPKPPTLTEHAVQSVTYKVHRKKGADDGAPRTMRVTYFVSLTERVEEWVCVEHDGFAEGKARAWWAARCRLPMPRSAVEAVVIAQHGLLAEPSALTTKAKAGDKFPEVVMYALGPKPDGPTPCPKCGAVNRRVVARTANPARNGDIVCGDCGEFHGFAGDEVIAHYGYFGDENSRCEAGMLQLAEVPGGVPADADDYGDLPF